MEGKQDTSAAPVAKPAAKRVRPPRKPASKPATGSAGGKAKKAKAKAKSYVYGVMAAGGDIKLSGVYASAEAMAADIALSPPEGNETIIVFRESRRGKVRTKVRIVG